MQTKLDETSNLYLNMNSKQTPYLLASMLFLGFFLSHCDDDVAAVENQEELISKITLTFTPSGQGSPVQGIANDPDGDGPADIAIEQNITLAANTTYTLSLFFEYPPNDITDEVREEADEHQVFFEWTSGLFSSPTGTGNIPDGLATAINYLDEDKNKLPLGLETSWTTGDVGSGDLQVVLKHLPGIKASATAYQDGESDVDITFPVVIQ